MQYWSIFNYYSRTQSVLQNNDGSPVPVLSDNQNPCNSVNRVFSGLANHFSNASLFSLCSTISMAYFHPVPATHVYNITDGFKYYEEYYWAYIGICLEGFLYGKIFASYALTCILANEVQLLFTGLGIYSGIFAMYLKCPVNESRQANILFYSLCLLYFLSAVNVAIDIVIITLEVSTNSSIYKNIIF